MSLVMVIDDHADTLYVLRRMIEQWGYESLAAETGEAALAMLADHKPDLIIVDAIMPGMSGVEFISLLRADAATAKIPIILNTAVGDINFVEDANTNGANEVWIKSKMNLDQIRERVAKYLKNS